MNSTRLTTADNNNNCKQLRNSSLLTITGFHLPHEPCLQRFLQTVCCVWIIWPDDSCTSNWTDSFWLKGEKSWYCILNLHAVLREQKSTKGKLLSGLTLTVSFSLLYIWKPGYIKHFCTSLNLRCERCEKSEYFSFISNPENLPGI